MRRTSIAPTPCATSTSGTTRSTSSRARRSTSLPEIAFASGEPTGRRAHNGTVSPVPFSILDLSPVVEGGDAAQALRNTIDGRVLHRHAGYGAPRPGVIRREDRG